MDYDKMAESYEELHKEEQLKKVRIIRDNLIIKPSDKLLDVGSGTGFYLNKFPCKVFAIDPSKELLKQNKYPHKQASAENIPFTDNAFDIVISVTAIHNFDDIEKGLKEMKRVGKQQFALSILKRSEKFKQIEKLIKKHFNITKIIEEEKDVIYIAKKTLN
ncbi:class I SAM-dependent methyltransferase [Candidatus Woesearchaeota archaeon]|nr:MAG: class I SAM-dependent methyltransferase [Candidatus Woesearchaeota archaeon]